MLVPVSIAGALLAGPLLTHVLGDRFAGVAAPLVPALAALPFAGITALASQIAALRMRPDIRVWTTGAGAIVFLGAAVIAIPVWGATGGTAAFLAGTVATAGAAALALPGVVERSLLALAAVTAGAVVIAGALT